MIKSESIPYDRDDLGLLHGIDAEIGFEFVVEIELVHAVPGRLSDDLKDRLENERCGLWRGGSRRRGRYRQPPAHRLTGRETWSWCGKEIRDRSVWCGLHIEAERGERGECVLEARESATLGMVGVDRAVRATLQNRGHEA